ncbi:unnamed protein product, partial [Mesorhabditis spiculigera]
MVNDENREKRGYSQQAPETNKEKDEVDEMSAPTRATSESEKQGSSNPLQQAIPVPVFIGDQTARVITNDDGTMVKESLDEHAKPYNDVHELRHDLNLLGRKYTIDELQLAALKWSGTPLPDFWYKEFRSKRGLTSTLLSILLREGKALFRYPTGILWRNLEGDQTQAVQPAVGDGLPAEEFSPSDEDNSPKSFVEHDESHTIEIVAAGGGNEPNQQALMCGHCHWSIGPDEIWKGSEPVVCDALIDRTPMDKFAKYYTDFVSPPLAPVYRPTAEEFTDPIAYVAKIKPEAEKYGVVKIVPPSNFVPTFVIDGSTFEFTPRVQKLNEIEASIREKIAFLEKLLNFWRLQGIDLDIVIIEKIYIDLYRLHTMVTKYADPETNWANKAKKVNWPAIGKALGFKNSQSTAKLRDNYQRYVQPYLEKTTNSALKKEEQSDEECDDEDEGNDNENLRMSMQGGKRRRAGRMMAGAPMPKQHGGKKRKHHDPMANVFCIKCRRGDNEAKLLLCEGCDLSMHTFCCQPPLGAVPKGEWHCSDCSADKIVEAGSNFGFYDANTSYNLDTFREFADKFKKEYFRKPLNEITLEEVEKEFWRNIIREEAVSVKYGADLRVDKVGSGFPRRDEDHRGADAKARHHYAHHPWNLNNLPVLKDSVLSHIDCDIPGMMIPWVYVGMCFSTFCWHTEDHWTYSINYNHRGEHKVWYGVAGADAERFEDAVRSISPGLFSAQRDLLHHMTVAVNPQVLIAKRVPVWTVHQGAGEFVITFPRAYHAGFNEGFNVAEAVNFAPTDWLRMGREAVGAYADVRRTCVFSHEELVMSMAVAENGRLSPPMCVAAYEELVAIGEREVKRRGRVAGLGIRSCDRVQWEKMPDEQRECRFCHTTVYLSAVGCSHGRLVCLDHVDKLCHHCTIDQMSLKYRHDLIEYKEILLRLQPMAEEYVKWQQQARRLLDSPKCKPTLKQIDELLAQARHAKFPASEVRDRLMETHSSCTAAIDRARQIIKGKVKFRTTTRMQRADTRPSISDVRQLTGELKALPCNVQLIVQELGGLMNRVNRWMDEAEELKGRAEQLGIKKEEEDGEHEEDEGEDEQALMDSLRKAVETGEQFGLRMDELEQLEKTLRLCEWRRRAQQIVEWQPWEGMEDQDDFLTRQRSSTKHIIALGDEGRSVGDPEFEHPSGIYQRLHTKMKRALVHDNKCEDWLRKGDRGVAQLEALWQEVRESDWMSGDGLDAIRDEVVLTRELAAQFDDSELSLVDLEGLVAECKKSVTLRDSPEIKRLADAGDRLVQFTDRLSALFHCPNSYYTLYDMLVGREDLAPILEGQPCVLLKREKSRPAVFEWDQLVDFDDSDEVKAHCSKLSDGEYYRMVALRRYYSEKPIAESCVCQQEKEQHLPTIVCFQCFGRSHVDCVEWNQFLRDLPEGTFLCIRCLRSRRPFREDIMAAMAQLGGVQSPEITLVREALKRSETAYRALIDGGPFGSSADLSETQREKMDALIVGCLASEIVIHDLMPRLNEYIRILHADTLHAQRHLMLNVRARPIRPEAPSRLFDLNQSRKRQKKAGQSKKRKKGEKHTEKEVYHDDDQMCGADLCLKPTSDHLNWILCEPGCGRWYHNICVGLTKAQAEDMEHYNCYKCHRPPAEGGEDEVDDHLQQQPVAGSSQ